MLTQDASDIVHEGLFSGYNVLVVISIVMQALLGLVNVISIIGFVIAPLSSFGYINTYCISLRMYIVCVQYFTILSNHQP